MNLPRGPLGFWPFDTEQDANLQIAVDEVWVMLRERAAKNIPLMDRLSIMFTDLYRDPWETFVKDYMSIAMLIGHAYTNQSEFYTVWEPKFAGMGYDKAVTEIVLGEFRKMIAEGQVPPFIADPLSQKPPGADSNSPFASAFKTMAIYAIVGIVAYGAVTGFAKGAAGRVLGGARV